MHAADRNVIAFDQTEEGQAFLRSVREHGGLLMKLVSQTLPMPSKVIPAQEKFGWKSPNQRKIQADAMRRQRARGLHRDCIAGLRVLAHIAMADGMVATEEANVLGSYLEARLAMLRVEHDALVTGCLLDRAAAHGVTPRSLQIAVNDVAKDRDYLTLVLDCALVLIEVRGDFSPVARDVMKSLKAAGTAAGWLSTANPSEYSSLT